MRCFHEADALAPREGGGVIMSPDEGGLGFLRRSSVGVARGDGDRVGSSLVVPVVIVVAGTVAVDVRSVRHGLRISYYCSACYELALSIWLYFT